LVRPLASSLRSAVTLHSKQGVIHLVLLSRQDADNLWRVEIHGRAQLVLSPAQIFSNGSSLALRQIGSSSFEAAFFPAVHAVASKDARPQPLSPANDLFEHLAWSEPKRSVSLRIDPIRPVGAAPAPLLNAASTNGSAPVQAPDDASFAQAGAWRVTLPAGAMAGLSDIFLAVRYQGDQARLLDKDLLLTDNFFNGTEWRIGLKRFLRGETSQAFTLQLLPLSKDAPVIFDEGRAPVLGKDAEAGSLQSIEALPEYQLDLTL